MMTSWSETEHIEAHILNTADTGNALLFEAKMILEPSLHDKVIWQRKAYDLIKSYGRKKLEQEIEVLHQQLFTQPEHLSFSKKIRLLFTNR